jgi:hypothetical protein
VKLHREPSNPRMAQHPSRRGGLTHVLGRTHSTAAPSPSCARACSRQLQSSRVCAGEEAGLAREGVGRRDAVT